MSHKHNCVLGLMIYCILNSFAPPPPKKEKININYGRGCTAEEETRQELNA